jgi:tetratricopeptide (TPR) repeat protein
VTSPIRARWDWPGAKAALRRAIALDGHYAYAFRMLGHVLSQTGRHHAARVALQRARELDPLYAMHHALSAQIAFQARDFDASLEHARQALAVDPDFWPAYHQVAQAHEQTRRNGGCADCRRDRVTIVRRQ